MENNRFVNLHIHTEYSLLDGACRIQALVERLKELGQTAAAITDHGNMYGVVEFWKTAKENGIKPIIGCEVYVAPRGMADRNPSDDAKPFHLLLLCENNEGYRNLVRIVSESNVNGFYKKPRADKALLKKYHKGLICLSACLAGEIPQLLLNGNFEEAERKASEYREIFGEGNYFIEVQNHGLKDELRILPMLYALSEKTGIPLAATNDCHYIKKSDAETQEILLCIQTGKNLGEPNGMRFETKEFYVKSADEMYSLFAGHEKALENTVLIAERCNVDFDSDGSIKLPEFEVPQGFTNVSYLRMLCEKGMTERYGENPPENVKQRLEHELGIITGMNFTNYFLIVQDFVNYARSHGIPVGPGRGSGAGSLCAYCIGITGIDPIEFNLMFERFLNPERGNMPDFDIDFCIEGRQKVKDYVSEKYGSDCVSEIIAFDTLKAKAAIRDVGKVIGASYQICDKTAKLIDHKLTISESLKESEEFAELYRSDSTVRRIADLAMQIEGMPRHTSVHAAGIVISSIPLAEIVPLQKSDNTIVTQYTAGVLESLGLLKMDFLGLRNLTIIRDAVREIHITDPDFDIDTIPFDDPDVYFMLSKGDTAGVFQFESEGITQKLIELSPERLDDLIAAISLYRPGPMKNIPVYVRNKKSPDKIKYVHPILKEILKDTFGVMVYQEQVMEVCRRLAGYTYGHADTVRRAMSKKKHDVMLEEKESFVSGAVSNGISADTANRIFDDMLDFASYAFNKSHAAAYSYLAYQTAYLKYHYRGIYMSSVLTSVSDNTEKLAYYISDCRKYDIPVIAPDINFSRKNFFCFGNKIYFGLAAIKNIGAGFAEKIIDERETNGIFRSFQNFCERMKGRELNKKAVESLIKSGAFDNLGLNRRQMLENYEYILSSLNNAANDFIEGQLNFLGENDSEEMNIRIAFKPEYDDRKLLAMEKDATGIYFSRNPLADYDYLSALLHTDRIETVPLAKDGQSVKIFCMIQDRKIHVTKKGEKMCFLSLSNGAKSIDAIVFSGLFAGISEKLSEDSIIFARGRVSKKDESTSIICEEIISENEFEEYFSRMKLCIKTASDSVIPENELRDICGKFVGKSSICFYLTDLRKTVKPRNPLNLKVCRESAELLKTLFPSENTGLIN